MTKAHLALFPVALGDATCVTDPPSATSGLVPGWCPRTHPTHPRYRPCGGGPLHPLAHGGPGDARSTAGRSLLPGLGTFPAGCHTALTPSQLTWKPGRVPGVENAALLGSSKAEGPYIERVRFPPNFVIQAHTHPDQRSYTILSGTWYIGYGDKFDETKLQPLPPGSFYVEPAGVNHFVATKDEPVVLQLSGVGPTATQFLDKAAPPNDERAAPARACRPCR